MSIHLTTLNLLRCGLAAGALIAASGLAHGQAIPLPELLVVSPSLVPIEAQKSGSSVSAMTGEQIRASGFSQLSDVMRTFPGMSVSQLGTRGTLTQFRVRGAEANHLLLVIDGVPANAVGDGEFNFADIPVDDIERVELLRGPQSGLYGANAHSGVLTIITRTGRGLAKPEFIGRVEGGTQGSAEGAMSARGSAGPFYGALTTTYATTNGFNIARNALPAGPESDGARRFAITGKGGVDFTPYFNVEGFVRHSRRRADSDPQDPNFLNTGLVEDRAGDTTAFNDTLARGEATLKLFEDRWIQSAKWTRSRQELGATEAFARSSASLGSAETFTYKSALLLELDDRRRREAPLHRRWSRTATNASASTASSCSGRISRPRATAIGAARPVSAANTFSSCSHRHDAVGVAAAGLQRAVPRRAHLALYGLAAGRADRRAAACEHRPRRHQSGLHRAVRLPHQHLRAEPDLVPESSVGWDVGWEQTFLDGRAVVDVTYFNSRLQNEIVTIFLPTFRSSVRNLDGVSTREGVEVAGKVSPTDWLTLGATYTYTDARDDKGVQEIRRPRHAASGTATVLFDGSRGKAIVNVVYNGQMPDTVFKFPTESVILNAYTLVAGQISYDTTPWSTIYIRGENVFNQRYEEVFSYRSPGAAVYAGLKIRSN